MKNALSLVALCVAMLGAGCSTAVRQAGTDMANSSEAAGAIGARAAVPPVDDAVVTTRVQSVLALDPQLATADIDVRTDNGHVTLTGEIKSMVLRKKAEALVRGVAGVRTLENQLIITG
jgi:hyperosmotically inducible protein